MQILKLIAEEFRTHGIESFFVGGFVRDMQLGITSDDIDICLVGVKDKDVVHQILARFSTKVTTEVGKKFSVWIAEIEGLGKVDFALARVEKKNGVSHTDFDVLTDSVTIEEDLSRRDLTINAMAINVISNELIDPFGGKEDLLSKVAREVSQAFAEDELRVIRAARFIATFNLTAKFSLLKLCSTLSPDSISRERIGTELHKAMNNAVKPSEFFRFLNKVGWLKHIFPEVRALIGVQQDPTFHPEGDAFEHTMQCIDQATDEFTRIVMLCHDLGKAITTIFDEKKQRWTAIGHEEAGVPLTLILLERLNWSNIKTRVQVATLTELHMIHAKEIISDKCVRETKRRLHSVGLTFAQLAEVCRCDKSGRFPLPPCSPDIRLEFADSVDITPIVTGVMLQEVGMKPGKEMGDALKKCIEWQDRGTLRADNWQKILREAGFKIITNE